MKQPQKCIRDSKRLNRGNTPRFTLRAGKRPILERECFAPLKRGCLHAGGQRAQHWPPAGPPKCAHLSPEGGFGQTVDDFRIFTRSDFELNRSIPEYVLAHLLKSGFTCENHEFQRFQSIFMILCQNHDIQFSQKMLIQPAAEQMKNAV